MNSRLVKEGLGWGTLLWSFGYILGIILFMIVPKGLIGWVISPLGILATLWVLTKKVKGDSLSYFFNLAVIWTIIAVIFDYLLLVKVFKPEDSYYKLDVYLYYGFTFILPLLVGWSQFSKGGKK